MKPQDQALANIAEAAKRVMNKETEVQPKDKDFVDLHSIDKGKRRGSTPLTEKDIDEANEFTKAAAKAAVAGDDEFEFDGKKFPTEMDVEVAKKILGESTNLDEATVNVEIPDPFFLSDGGRDPFSRDFNKLLKKYRVKGDLLGDPDGMDMPEVQLTGKKKDLERILADPDGWDDDGWLADGIKESADSEKAIEEAYIDVDTADPKSIEFAKLMKKYRVKGRIITMKGPGGGMPLVRLTGKKKDLEGILKDPMGWQDDGFLAGFIEESLNFDEDAEIDEEIYRIAEEQNLDLDGLTEEQLDELIGKALKKVGSKIKKAVKGRVTTAGRAERLTKKADKADKKQADRDKLKKAKARLKIQKAKKKKKADSRKAAKARLKQMKNKKNESVDFEPHWMYDPETGEKERAEKPEDHERLKALGWGHEPPVKK